MKAQLAICLAFRPEIKSEEWQNDGSEELSSGKDTKDALETCRNQQKKMIYNRQILDCYTFKRMVPYYDQVLGKVELSPEEEAAAREMGVEECGRIINSATMAKLQINSCLRGLANPDDVQDMGFNDKSKAPDGFKEAYGDGKFPTEERALVKICTKKWGVNDAWTDGRAKEAVKSLLIQRGLSSEEAERAAEGAKFY